MRNILKNELNNTDTAHNFWNSEWSQNTKQTEWKIPDYEVIKVSKKLKKNLKILDLGSGIGRHSLLLAEMGHQVFATDASKNGITILTLRTFLKKLIEEYKNLKTINNNITIDDAGVISIS